MVLYFRRMLPESPRRLVTQGRVAEATAIVERIEAASGTVHDGTGHAGAGPGSSAGSRDHQPSLIRPADLRRSSGR